MPVKIVRRHGSPNWYLRGSVRGTPVDESTGVADRRRALEIRAKRETELLDASVFGRRAVSTFLQAAVAYLESGGERRFMKPLLDYFGTTRLAVIDQAAIDAAARKLYPGRKPSTVNRQLYTPVSAVLRYAARSKLCDLHELARPRQPEGVVRWLRHDEAEALLAAYADHVRPIGVFMLFTGVRRGEALALDWRDVDLPRCEVMIRDTKNGEPRAVPLYSRAVAALANLPGERTGAVFRTADGQPYLTSFKTAHNAACRRVGIEAFRIHDWRHTWATWHYAANHDLAGLKKLGGWKSDRMVLRYAHANVDALAASIENMGKKREAIRRTA